MTVAVKERTAGSSGVEDRLFDPGGWRPLDEVVSTAWEELNHFTADADCPVCEGSLKWDRSNDLARCADCGSVLS